MVKAAIIDQIKTLLDSNKPNKISPVDHNTVATSINNYVDKKFLYAGSIGIDHWARRDSGIRVTFSTPLATSKYMVIGQPYSAAGGYDMCRTLFSIVQKTNNGFSIGWMVPKDWALEPEYGNQHPVYVNFEFVVFAIEELP